MERVVDYKKYIRSPEWKRISDMVKERDGWACKLCNSKTNLSTHHRTYEHLGNEENHLVDLVCLCQGCHDHFHNKKPQTPARKKKKTRKPAKKTSSKNEVRWHKREQAQARAVVQAMESSSSYIKLTPLLLDAVGNKGGYTKGTKQWLGVPANSSKGWKSSLVGTRIHKDDYKEALKNKGRRSAA